MALNIKNEHVVALAKEAARRTGLSQTSALEKALAQYLAALPEVRDERARRVRELVTDFNAGLSDADRSAMRRKADELYDDAGLFR